MNGFTSRMTALMGLLRRERDGLTADALDAALPPEARYGLNMGVSLPAIRRIARSAGHDHAFARYLYRQDVRELRLAALWIASPEALGADELDFWMEGRMPAELLDEVAFALLSRAGVGDALLGWLRGADPARVYAAAMALARSSDYDAVEALNALGVALHTHVDHAVVARGAVVLLDRLADDARCRPKIAALLDSLDQGSATGRFLREEIAWRLEMRTASAG